MKPSDAKRDKNGGEAVASLTNLFFTRYLSLEVRRTELGAGAQHAANGRALW